MVQIRSNLKPDLTKKSIQFLWLNADVFAWSALDMPEILADVIVHELNVDPKYRQVQHKKRSFAPKRQKAIDQEVDKLSKVRFIKEVYYPKWVANVVMVKKANSK